MSRRKSHKQTKNRTRRRRRRLSKSTSCALPKTTEQRVEWPDEWRRDFWLLLFFHLAVFSVLSLSSVASMTVNSTHTDTNIFN
jgi:hypothetical protein